MSSLLKVIFARRTGVSLAALGSYYMRTFTWSKWSHVGILSPDGNEVYEATIAGVVLTPMSDFKAKYSVIEIDFFTCPNTSATYAFLNGQLGKKYDWWGAFAFLFRRKMLDKSRWFCSELVSAAVKAGGTNLFHDDSRVTPQDLFNHGLRQQTLYQRIERGWIKTILGFFRRDSLK